MKSSSFLGKGEVFVASFYLKSIIRSSSLGVGYRGIVAKLSPVLSKKFHFCRGGVLSQEYFIRSAHSKNILQLTLT